MVGNFKIHSYSLSLLTYFLLAFTVLCGGNFHIIGPLSLRHVSTILLLGLAIVLRKRIYIKNWSFPLYLGYLSVAIFCCMINGDIYTRAFWQSLYTYHLPCIAIALGLPALVKNIDQVKLFVWALIGLYVINSLISFFQYFNFELAWTIATRLSSSAEEGMNKAIMYSESSDSLIGYSLVAGVFGFVVTNGYFLATYLPVFTHGIYDKKKIKKLVSIVFFIFAGIAIFITQQRMAFVSFVLFASFFLWFGMDKKWSFIAIFIGLIAISYYGINNIEMGRLSTNTNNDTRIHLFYYFFDFLDRGYWAFGSSEAYTKLYDKAQHNTFLSAWVGGGIPSFLIFTILYFKLFRDNMNKILTLKRKKILYPYTLSFAVASLIFLLYSLTHSAGVNSGSPMFWIVYTMMCISYNIEHKIVETNRSKYIIKKC